MISWWWWLQNSLPIEASAPGGRALQEAGERLVAEEAHDLDLGVRPRQTLTDHGIVGRAALLGEVDELVELAAEAERLHRCAGAALVAEQGHRDGPAAVHLADDVLLRAAGVAEEHLVELGLAGDHLDRPHLHARLAHVDQQERDAAVLGRGRVGAGQHEDVGGEMTGRRPDLLAVDHPLVAVEHGPTAEVAEVAAGGRLAVALAPQVLARQHAGQVVTLLLVGAPAQHRVAEHRDAEAVVRAARGCAGAGELLGHHHALERGEPGTADLLRPAERQVAVLVQHLAPLGGEGGGVLVVERSDALPVGGQVRVEEGAHLGAEDVGLGWVGEIHAREATTEAALVSGRARAGR